MVTEYHYVHSKAEPVANLRFQADSPLRRSFLEFDWSFGQAL